MRIWALTLGPRPCLFIRQEPHFHICEKEAILEGSQYYHKDGVPVEHPGGSAVERLPSAQGVIPGSWDRGPHWAPGMEPASPSACVSASLSASLMNTHIKS